MHGQATSGQATFGILPAFGYTVPSVSFNQLGTLALPSQASGLSSSVEPAVTVAAEYMFGLTNAISMASFAGLSTFRLNVRGSESTTFAVDGVLTPGTFNHMLDVTATMADAGVGVAWSPAASINLTASLAGAFGITSQVGYTEAVLEPQGVTYPSGERERTVLYGSWTSRSAFVPYAQATVAFPVVLTEDTWLEPFVRVRQMIGSMDTQADVRYTSVALGVGVRWSMAPDDGEASLPKAPPALPAVRPHYAVVERSLPSIPEVFASVNVSVRSAAGVEDPQLVVRSTMGVIDTVLVQCTPGMPANVRIWADTTIVAEPPDLVIRPIVATDDSIRLWTLVMATTGGIAYASSGTDVPPQEIRIPMASLSKAVVGSLWRNGLSVVLRAFGRGGGTASSDTSTVVVHGDGTKRELTTMRTVIRIEGFASDEASVPQQAVEVLARYRDLIRKAERVSIVGTTYLTLQDIPHQQLDIRRAIAVRSIVGRSDASTSGRVLSKPPEETGRIAARAVEIIVDTRLP